MAEETKKQNTKDESPKKETSKPEEAKKTFKDSLKSFLSQVQNICFCSAFNCDWSRFFFRFRNF